MNFKEWFDKNYKINDISMELALKEVAFKAWQAALQSQWQPILTVPKNGEMVIIAEIGCFSSLAQFNCIKDRLEFLDGFPVFNDNSNLAKYVWQRIPAEPEV